MKKQLLQIVTAVTMLSTPNSLFAQAANLGTAENFVLYTSTGAVTNTGTSQLTGHVGTNSGSSTGFGNVNGVMHDNDGATLQCKADLLSAYNQLNDAIPNFFVAPLLGNGDTLNAGVYKIAGVTTLSGDLILNAQGNAGAVFIFQVGAAFSTSFGAKVKLINGAQACNVFWKVEGMVNMASATSFKGTLIANNAAINMSVNDTLEGRALSTSGAITLNGTLAYTPIGCGKPLLTGPSAPNLLSTAAYALFSGNGGVTNSGLTRLTGDVGTNVGLTTGFDSLFVTGIIHRISDSSTSKCAADLITVYNYLNTLPHDIELLYPAQFGNNLVLTPHTYLMNAATAFNGTVYLNAQGNADAVFIIKINGALNSGTYSKVVLINGAQAKNVYWKVDGAVNLNDYSVFNGTIVANNGAISLGTGDSLNGRALTTNGALASAAIIGNTGSGNSLPVSWLYFRGKVAQKNVLLEWATAKELNNSFFVIEKSRDGNAFETLTNISAAQVNGNAEYSFTDQQPYNLNYYRISQTDKDGQRKYYETIQVKVSAAPRVQIMHYVQQNSIYVQASGATPGNGSIQLYSIEGRKISSQNIVLTKDASSYKIEKPTTKGLYLLYIESNGEKLYTGKVMVL